MEKTDIAELKGLCLELAMLHESIWQQKDLYLHGSLQMDLDARLRRISSNVLNSIVKLNSIVTEKYPYSVACFMAERELKFRAAGGHPDWWLVGIREGDD